MKISCEHVWREVSNYLDGEIEPGLRANMEDHLRGCKHCTAVVDGTRNVLRLVADERVLEVPLGFERRLQRRLENGMPQTRTKKLGWLVAVAALLVMGAFALGGAPSASLRSEHARAAVGVPSELMVVVAHSGKTFHVAGCRFLHEKTGLRTISASQAAREGYSPCVRCMREYLGAELVVPGTDELAENSARSPRSRNHAELGPTY